MARPNHALNEARAEIAALNARLDAVNARLDGANPASGTIVPGAAIGDPNRPLPPGIFAEPGTGLLRSIKTGTPWSPDADSRPYEVRRQEADQAHANDSAAILEGYRQKARDRGLPSNVIVGWDNLPRWEKGAHAGKLLTDYMPEAQHDPKLFMPTEVSAASLTPAPAAAPRPLTPYEITQAQNDADMLALREVDRRFRQIPPHVGEV